MPKFFSMFFFVVGICILSGCAAGPYHSIPYDVNKDKERTLKVVILDKDLNNQFASKRVVILTQKTDLTEDNRLKVYCEIRNMKKEVLRLQVQTIFRDDKGFQIGDDTNWELILIPQYSTYAYKTTAFNVKAKDYTIRIRKAQ
ncbi:MAG: DUF1425 domain-containing protein [Candidatus Omnitrophota bacterium]